MKTNNQTPEFKIIQLEDSREANFLVPEIFENQSLSVVSTDVLEKLLRLLPNTAFDEIKSRLIGKIGSSNDLGDLCKVLQNELNFHKSVNLIESFFLLKNDIDKHVQQNPRLYRPGNTPEIKDIAQ